MSTVETVEQKEDPEEAERQLRIQNKPALSQCFNLLDFEAVAKKVMKRGAWGYYSSAADDEIVSTFLPADGANHAKQSADAAREP